MRETGARGCGSSGTAEGVYGRAERGSLGCLGSSEEDAWMLGSRGDFPPEHLDLWRVVGRKEEERDGDWRYEGQAGLGRGTGDEEIEQWGRRLEGLEAEGTGHRTMRARQTMGGRGVGGRASGSGGRLQREKWVREGRKRTTAREIDASKLKEDGEGRADPEVVGAPPSRRGTVGPADSGGTDVSRACRVLFLAASPSLGNEAGDPRLGRERPLRRGEPVPWFPRDPRAPPTR